MQIQIHADDFDLTEGLHGHIAKRLAYALNHGSDIVSRIVVRFGRPSPNYIQSEITS